MSKKIIAILLTVMLTFSLITAAVVSTSAAVDSEGCYVPSEGIENTSHLLFYMPESWFTEGYGITGAGAYWWGGLDACGSVDGTSVGASWPGYKIHLEDAENSIFYVDFPMDTPDGMSPIVFNNFLDGGDANVDEVTGEIVYDISKEQYVAAKQTTDICATYYSEGDNDYYDNVLDGDFFSLAETALEEEDDEFFGDYKDNFFIEEDWGISFTFDNMIYVINPAKSDVNFKGKETCVGEWYFYYGDGEYGSLPSKDMAEANGLVRSLADSSSPDEPAATTAPADPQDPTQTPTTKPNDSKQETTTASNIPQAATNPTSSSTDTASKDTVNNNGTVQTGAVSMIVVILTVMAVAAGAVYCVRRRRFE